jgi:hypothetical protein
MLLLGYQGAYSAAKFFEQTALIHLDQKLREAWQAAGHKVPIESDLYVHLKKMVKKQKKDAQTEWLSCRNCLS